VRRRENPSCVPELFSAIGEDDRGQRVGLIARRTVMTIFAAISVLALAGAIGQISSTSHASGLTLDAPHTVRGGLFWQARIDIRPSRAIESPRLVFGEGWLEGMQVNSIEPAAQSESSRDGRLVLSYDRLKPGDRLQIWMQFEVDPTNTGKRSLELELDDAQTPLARIDREIRVLP
jgi:hypothetical protein